MSARQHMAVSMWDEVVEGSGVGESCQSGRTDVDQSLHQAISRELHCIKHMAALSLVSTCPRELHHIKCPRHRYSIGREAMPSNMHGLVSARLWRVYSGVVEAMTPLDKAEQSIVLSPRCLRFSRAALLVSTLGYA